MTGDADLAQTPMREKLRTAIQAAKATAAIIATRMTAQRPRVSQGNEAAEVLDTQFPPRTRDASLFEAAKLTRKLGLQ